MKQRNTILIIALLYLVGVISILTPYKYEIFLLTPIILGFTLVAYLNITKPTNKALYLYALIGFIGFTVEVIGVKTGFPFGAYHYNTGLSLKLFDVPVVLAVNWILLTVLAHHALLKAYKPLRFVAPPLMVTLLDFLIEPVAIHFNWWQWQESEIPFTNYIGWFATAFLINTILLCYEKSTQKSSYAILLMVIQFLFFALINITL